MLFSALSSATVLQGSVDSSVTARVRCACSVEISGPTWNDPLPSLVPSPEVFGWMGPVEIPAPTESAQVSEVKRHDAAWQFDRHLEAYHWVEAVEPLWSSSGGGTSRQGSAAVSLHHDRSVRTLSRSEPAATRPLIPVVEILGLALNAQAWAAAGVRAPSAASSVPVCLMHPTADVRPWPPGPELLLVTDSPHGRSKTDIPLTPSRPVARVPYGLAST